jgi:hypothetical protein
MLTLPAEIFVPPPRISHEFLLYSSLNFLSALLLCYYLDGHFGNLSTMVYMIACTALSSQLALLFWISLWIPYVMASPQSSPFPDIVFKDFSDFIISNFGEKISLPTVIMMLLSMTNNTELLSLHFKQNSGSRATSWMRCLARAIMEQLGDNNISTLFSDSEFSMFTTATTKHTDVASFAVKLSDFSKLLGLYPYSNRGKFTGTLQHISHSSIQPALVICPNSSVCLTAGCNRCFLKQNSHTQHPPRVTLIKGTEVFKNVMLLSGLCNNCETIYYADHEHTFGTKDVEPMQFFLNSATYMKIGQKLWADRKFSTAVINGTYHLHASTSGWANYFNDTYGNDSVTLSRRQVWAALIHESIRQSSEMSGIDFVIRDTASIEEVTEEAFTVLGSDGLIQPARNHACAECSQPYRAPSNVVLNPNNEPSALSSVENTKIRNVTMRVIDGMVNGTKVFF